MKFTKKHREEHYNNMLQTILMKLKENGEFYKCYQIYPHLCLKQLCNNYIISFCPVEYCRNDFCLPTNMQNNSMNIKFHPKKVRLKNLNLLKFGYIFWWLSCKEAV